MSVADKKIAVIGGGSWATAIMKMLTNQNQVINWWMHNEASASHILKYRHNPKYLQSVPCNSIWWAARYGMPCWAGPWASVTTWC